MGNQNDKGGTPPPQDPPQEPQKPGQAADISMSMDWNPEQLEALTKVGIDPEIINAQNSKIAELEQKIEADKQAAERKELLLELSQVSRKPKLVASLKDASIETIKGALTAERLGRGPANFGVGSNEEEPPGPPTHYDHVKGGYVDAKGRLVKI